jgi:hypothetical protein
MNEPPPWNFTIFIKSLTFVVRHSLKTNKNKNLMTQPHIAGAMMSRLVPTVTQG